MSTFEFDDVIAIAKVIVSPEQSAAELKQLRIELAQLRATLDKLTSMIEKHRAHNPLCECHCFCFDAEELIKTIA